MRRINKQVGHYRRLGHSMVRQFLEDAWDETRKEYTNCNFENFKSKKFKNLLLLQQKHKCCYCMRDLNVSSGTTIEHVMPHKPKDDSIVAYYLDNSRMLRKNVVYKHVDKEDNKKRKLKIPPYPHFCAYENLVASCDGSLYDSLDEANNQKIFAGNLHRTCNNVRGNEKIIPLFYLRHIQDYVKYDEDGIMLVNAEHCYKNELVLQIDEAIGVLELNYHTLCLIRKAWARLAQENYRRETVFEAKQDKSLRLEILETLLLGKSDFQKLIHDKYWNLLCQYFYFLGYYKSHLL